MTSREIRLLGAIAARTDTSFSAVVVLMLLSECFEPAQSAFPYVGPSLGRTRKRGTRSSGEGRLTQRSISFPTHLLAVLEAEAAAQGVSLSLLVRQVLERRITQASE